MRFVKIPVILSTVPELNCVEIRERYRENRETISIVKPQQNISRISAGSLHFGVCVTTAANKLR